VRGRARREERYGGGDVGMASVRGHRRCKTAGVTQLEAFDALALENGGDWDGVQEESTAGDAANELFKRGTARLDRSAVENLSLETATLGALPEVGDFQPSAEQKTDPDQPTLTLRQSHRSSRAAQSGRYSQEQSIRDGLLRERLRDLEVLEGNKFIQIIDRWESLTLLDSGDIVAEDFCLAMESILIVVDALGGALSLIKNDWIGQMTKVRQSCVRHGVATLHRMIECENAKGEGTDCLIWLKRSLQFVEIMMTKFVSAPFRNNEGRNTLGDAVDIAYKRTLHDAHPWIVRAVASKIRFAVPPAELFVKRLYEKDSELVMDAIRLWLRIMRPKLAALVTYYNVNSIEKVTNCRALPESISVAVLA